MILINIFLAGVSIQRIHRAYWYFKTNKNFKNSAIANLQYNYCESIVNYNRYISQGGVTSHL